MLFVRTVFCDVESVSWVKTIFMVIGTSNCIYSVLDKAMAQLIGEIRSDYFYIPGFNSCELEYIVNQASALPL